jgi:hypothetical protein
LSDLIILFTLCIISNIENCETVTELTKQLSVLEAINWIDKSWNDTNASTVVKCFHDANRAAEVLK